MDCEYITVHSNKQKYIFVTLNISYFNNLCNRENRQNGLTEDKNSLFKIKNLCKYCPCGHICRDFYYVLAQPAFDKLSGFVDVGDNHMLERTAAIRKFLHNPHHRV